MHLKKKKKEQLMLSKHNQYQSLVIVQINTYGGLEATKMF